MLDAALQTNVRCQKTGTQTAGKHLSKISVPDCALTFPQTATDEQLLDGVKTWADLLAEARFSEAYQLTAHDSYYAWTPDLIRSVVAGYGLPHKQGEHEYRVSKISEAKGGSLPCWEVCRWKDAEPRYRVGEVSFDLPLDGEWSDLTATFGIVERDNRLVLVLQEIHVF